MRKGLQEIVDDLRLGYSVVGIASMFKIFFGPEPHNYAQALKCDKAGYLAFFRRMLDVGHIPHAQPVRNRFHIRSTFRGSH